MRQKLCHQLCNLAIVLSLPVSMMAQAEDRRGIRELDQLRKQLKILQGGPGVLGEVPGALRSFVFGREFYPLGLTEEQERLLNCELVGKKRDAFWSGLVELSDQFCVRDLVIDNGTIIQGRRVEIEVAGDLTIKGTATIRAYDYRSTPPFPRPPRAPDGPSGQSWPRGPGTEGRGVTANGRHGGAGGNGADGTTGISQGAGFVSLMIGDASGKLNVILRGLPAGDGGDGGDAGRGGDGEQGGRARSGDKLFGITAGCKSGPGDGGNGGNGGNGGAAGNGGDGGNGGGLRIYGPPGKDRSNFIIERLDLRPGPPGRPGQPGRGGDPGQFGWGGRGARGCKGREVQRKGRSGLRGSDGLQGRCGQPGRPGSFSNELGIEVRESVTRVEPSRCALTLNNRCRGRLEPAGNRLSRSRPCAEVEVLQGFWGTLLLAGEKVTDVPVGSGASCPSVLFSPDARPSSEFFQRLGQAAFNFADAGDPAPPETCRETTTVDQLGCCIGGTNLSLDCLRHVDLRGAGAWENGVFSAASHLLAAREVARSSRVLRFDQLPTLPGGKSYYRWYGPLAGGTFDGTRILVTELTPNLIERLSVLASELAPRLLEATGRDLGGFNALACKNGQYETATIDWQSTGHGVPLSVHTGIPTDLYRPSAMPAADHTLVFRIGTQTSFMGLLPRTYCPVGSICSDGARNQCLSELIEQIRLTQTDPISCSIEARVLVALRQQLNDPETSSIFFYASFLRGLVEAADISSVAR